MTNQQNAVELLIRARDETQRAVRSAQNGMERFAAAQQKTLNRRNLVGGKANEIVQLEGEYRSLQAEVGRLGKKIDDARRPSKALSAEFEQQRARAAALKAELRDKATAYVRLTTNARGSFAAMDAVATGMRQEQVATDASTAALRANTSALGANAIASRGRAGGGIAKTGSFGLRPHEMTNLSYQVNDVATQLASGTPTMQVFAQQAGQIAQIFPSLLSGFVKFAPVIGSLTAVMAPFVVRLQQVGAEAETLKEFDLLLTRSGEAASYSAPKLAAVAQEIDNYAGSLKEARAAVTEFVGDSVAPEYLERFGKTAQDVAKVLKLEVTDAAKKVSDAFTGNADAVLALDDELNFLTDSERKHIEKLRESKKDAEARTQAFAIFERKYNQTAEKMRGPWSQILADFGVAWQSFVNFVNFIDFAKARRQIDDLVQRIQRLTSMLPGANTRNAEATGRTFVRNFEQIERLEEQQEAYRRRSQGRENAGLANRIAHLRREQERLRALGTQQVAAEQPGPEIAAPDTTLDPPAPANQDRPAGADDAERRAKAQADFLRDLRAENAERAFQITLIDQEERERRVLEELREKELAAAEVGLQLSQEQRAEIRKSVESLYDAERAHEAIRLIEEARLELAQARGEVESRDDFIERKLRDAGLYTSQLDEATGELIVSLTREGQEYSNILRTIWDINEATRQRTEAEKAVNDLVSLRSTLQERETYLRDTGQGFAADLVGERIAAINEQLVAAIDNAIAMWRALGGPEAEVAIAALEATREEALGVSDAVLVSGKQIKDMLVNGATNAFDRFTQALAEGDNAIRALGNAFMQFAADFLREIARMIFQQAVLNALQALGGGGKGGGIESAIASTINTAFGGGFNGNIPAGAGTRTDSPLADALRAIKRHSGGLIGSAGRTNPVSASVFNTALRYHEGGVVGLKPNEVPIIGLRNEEMLTEDDPRHRFNGGLSPKGPASVKVVNVLDPADLLDRALGGDDGERIFLNFVRRNAGAFKAALG
jgi:hypothetical protein